MRIGLFGGSFNPIHNGHITLAENIKKELSLDKVILIPSGEAPHKSSAEYADAKHRLSMCRLAIEDTEGFEVSSFETDRSGRSYSIYTVKHFRELYPNDELFLIVGSDMLMCFDKWYRFEEILSLTAVVAATRNGDDIEQLKKIAQKLQKYGKIIVVNNSPVIVSSTKIRKMIKNNEDTYCYLREKVVKYIRMNDLYPNDSEDEPERKK